MADVLIKTEVCYVGAGNWTTGTTERDQIRSKEEKELVGTAGINQTKPRVWPDRGLRQ